MRTQKNSAGRTLPSELPVYGRIIPFSGAEKHHTDVKQLPDHDELIDEMRTLGKSPLWVPSIEAAVIKSGLKDGMRISFHHHLRLSDLVLTKVLGVLTDMGFKDLILCLSSVMGPSCASVLQAAQAGVIGMIETTGMKAPLSTAVESGELQIPVIFRSHGGRARAIESGDITIDVAFIAASCADDQGNLTGCIGKNRFGSLGYAIPDARRSKVVIGITDELCPSIPRSIPSASIDMLIKVDHIGTGEGLSGGSLRRTRRPIERLIARRAVSAILATGVLKPGFSFQAGSGGISLEVSTLLTEYTRDQRIPCSFTSGGVTAPLLSLLKEGSCERVYDVQSFDSTASRSLGENDRHIEMSSSLYGNPEHGGCIAHQLDLMVLSATEVDTCFHVNSITGTDGRILGALGGAPDTAAGSLLTVVVIPSFRGRIPSVTRDVYTICTPGDTVDMIVTERGVSVNPKRVDLMKSLIDSGLQILPIEQLLDQVYAITGEPQSVKSHHTYSRPLALVEYRDGSVIDALWE